MIKRNTKQKRLILETLQAMSHPSATMVYEEVQRCDPTISRATVFRVLADAAEEGTLLRLHIPESDDRFDITLNKHRHIKCRICGRVDDIDIVDSENIAIVADAHGYKVESWEIGFTGLCPDCAKTNI